MGTIVGFKNPTAGATSGVWTGETNTFASDGSDATVSADNVESLRATGFDLQIPDNAIIRGIEVWIEGEGDDASSANRDLDVSLTLDGTAAVGTSITYTLPQSTDAVVKGGGSTNLWTILESIDITEVNASTFGVHIIKNTATGVVNIDHIVMKVYYDGGVRGEWAVDFDTKRVTHKRFYLDYNTGSGGTAPIIGDVLFNNVGSEVARVVTVEDWNTAVFGTYAMGEEHGGVTWVDTDTYEICSYVDFDTEVAGGLNEDHVGDAFTVTGGSGTRTGVIRHVFSNGITGRMWWDVTGEGGTAFTGDETIQVDSVSLADASVAETANVHTATVDGTVYEPSRIQLNYDGETGVFESVSGGLRLRDTLGFQHNMVVCDVTTGATAMIMEDREDQLVGTEGTLFLIDIDGTFTDDNTLEACVEIDYDTELNGGFFDLIAAGTDELEGASSLETATVRRVIDNGVTGTIYVTGASGTFTPGEILRENTGDQTRGSMTTAVQRDRVGGAIINGSATTSTAAHFSSQALFSDLMDQFDELVALEDDNPAVGEVQDQGYRLLNAWQVPFYSARWLIKGAVNQITTQGGGDNDSVHTNYFHLGALGDDTNTNIYVDQGGTVLEQFWPSGTFEFLLRNKNKNANVNGGSVTFYARLFTELYDFATVSAINLRNPVGLNTSDDVNNNTTEATVIATQAYHDIRFMFASHTITHGTGTGTLPVTGQALYNSTRSECVLICRPPDLVTSGTDLHISSNGQTLSTWANTEALVTPNYFDFDGQASQFSIGQAIENADDDWNGTVAFVQQYGAGRGRVWFNDILGVLADDDPIEPDGGGAVIATVNGAPASNGDFAATLGAAVSSDTTVLKDIGDGNGDQPYYMVIDANTATALQSYEMSKLLARDESGSATDLGSVLYPDNTVIDGRLYQKANTLISPANVNRSAPMGTFAGGTWFLAEGIFIEDLAAADAQKFQLTDANGIVRDPPNVQAISIGGLAIGDRVLVTKRAEIIADGTDTLDFNNGSPDTIDVNGTGDFLDNGFENTVDANGTTSITISGTTSNDGTYAIAAVTASLITLATNTALTNELAHTTAIVRGDNIDKDMFSDGTGNSLGDSDYVVVETLPGWLPSTGTIIVTDATDGSEAPGYEDVYTYTSYTASTFSLSTTLLRTYTGTARVWVPFIRKTATSTTESQTFIYSIDVPVQLNVRKKGIVPFSQELTITSGGLSAVAVRQSDTIVE